jgi:hypothetical protein
MTLREVVTAIGQMQCCLGSRGGIFTQDGHTVASQFPDLCNAQHLILDIACCSHAYALTYRVNHPDAYRRALILREHILEVINP